MKSFINAIDDLPLIVKIILCIPVLDFVWSIYKLFKSIEKNNVVGIIIAAVLLVFGCWFVWIIDIVTLILKGQVWWLD